MKQVRLELTIQAGYPPERMELAAAASELREQLREAELQVLMALAEELVAASVRDSVAVSKFVT